MSTTKSNALASYHYYSAKTKAIAALKAMTQALTEIGCEHVNFHKHFDDVPARLQEITTAYGKRKLDADLIRSTALDTYLSKGDLPKAIALGYFEIEKVVKDLELQEKELDGIQKKTAIMLENILGDRRCKCNEPLPTLGWSTLKFVGSICQSCSASEESV